MEDIFFKFLAILISSNSTYNEDVEVITLYPKQADTTFLTENNIDVIPIQGNGIQIESASLKFKFYWNDKEFSRKYYTAGKHRVQDIFIYNYH